VTLVGGSGPQEGYVYALNPATKLYGPVCDDYFDINAVSSLYYLGTFLWNAAFYSVNLYCQKDIWSDTFSLYFRPMLSASNWNTVVPAPLLAALLVEQCHQTSLTTMSSVLEPKQHWMLVLIWTCMIAILQRECGLFAMRAVKLAGSKLFVIDYRSV
jgi:hypothetical protein